MQTCFSRYVFEGYQAVSVEHFVFSPLCCVIKSDVLLCVFVYLAPPSERDRGDCRTL